MLGIEYFLVELVIVILLVTGVVWAVTQYVKSSSRRDRQSERTVSQLQRRIDRLNLEVDVYIHKKDEDNPEEEGTSESERSDNTSG